MEISEFKYADGVCSIWICFLKITKYSFLEITWQRLGCSLVGRVLALHEGWPRFNSQHHITQEWWCVQNPSNSVCVCGGGVLINRKHGLLNILIAVKAVSSEKDADFRQSLVGRAWVIVRCKLAGSTFVLSIQLPVCGGTHCLNLTACCSQKHSAKWTKPTDTTEYFSVKPE